MDIDYSAYMRTLPLKAKCWNIDIIRSAPYTMNTTHFEIKTIVIGYNVLFYLQSIWVYLFGFVLFCFIYLLFANNLLANDLNE